VTEQQGQAAGVVITVSQMYAELRSVHEIVTKLHEQFAGVPTQVNDHEVRLRTLEGYGLNDHDKRIADLEQRKYVSPTALGWAWGTAIAALGVLVTFLAAFRGGG
jgi:hypothetical protein